MEPLYHDNARVLSLLHHIPRASAAWKGNHPLCDSGVTECFEIRKHSRVAAWSRCLAFVLPVGVRHERVSASFVGPPVRVGIHAVHRP